MKKKSKLNEIADEYLKAQQESTPEESDDEAASEKKKESEGEETPEIVISIQGRKPRRKIDEDAPDHRRSRRND